MLSRFIRFSSQSTRSALPRAASVRIASFSTGSPSTSTTPEIPSFLKANPSLKMVDMRLKDDGFFPIIKQVEDDWTLSELKTASPKRLSEIIQSMPSRFSEEPSSTSSEGQAEHRLGDSEEKAIQLAMDLVTTCFDLSNELLSELFAIIQDVAASAEPDVKAKLLCSQVFDNMVWGASHFGDQELLSSLLQFVTFHNIKLSNQSYLKCFITMAEAGNALEDKELQDELNTEILQNSELQFKKDHPESFQFSANLFKTHMFNEFGIRASSNSQEGSRIFWPFNRKEEDVTAALDSPDQSFLHQYLPGDDDTVLRKVSQTEELYEDENNVPYRQISAEIDGVCYYFMVQEDVMSEIEEQNIENPESQDTMRFSEAPTSNTDSEPEEEKESLRYNMPGSKTASESCEDGDAKRVRSELMPESSGDNKE